jgi:glucose/arabinose dehydrogenase
MSEDSGRDRARLSRRTLLATGLAGLGSLAGCATSLDGGDPATSPPTPATDTPSDGPGPPPTVDAFPEAPLGATQVAAGFTSPVGVEVPTRGRYFVVDQPGTIWLVDEQGRTRWADLRDRVVDVSGYSEQGLLGLAVHPAFADNGRFYVRYSAPPREGTPADYAHTFVLSEFTADPAARSADLTTERTLLELPQPQANHNAGAVAFGPDGLLYVATGDGGGANDTGNGHVDDWYDPVAGGNGQDVTANLLGSILRVDPDGRSDGKPYAIPAENPLVDRAGWDEHFAWGLRNPWRMSFDTDGRLYAADVGQNEYEEVDLVTAGGNYGWNVREGTHCFRRDTCPRQTADGEALLDPVIEYPHGGQPVSGLAVVGGYRYEGEALSGYQDCYLVADWQAGGQLFAARPVEEGLWPTTTVEVADPFGTNVLAFGRDPAQELYVCTTERQGVAGESGALYRLTAAD